MSGSSQDHDPTIGFALEGAETVARRLLEAAGGREVFERNFHARTHSPERRAASEIADGAALWTAGTDAAVEAGATPEMVSEWQAKFLKLWLAYQHAGARVMNWMITGPARFPVARNEKRMETERKRGEEFYAHAKGAAEFVRRRLRSAEKAAASVAAAEVSHREKVFPGGKIVLNKPLDRVQLVFEGRPTPETIIALKSRAFRWSPREGAWQRQLTQNGVWAAEAMAKSLGAGVGYADGEPQSRTPGADDDGGTPLTPGNSGMNP